MPNALLWGYHQILKVRPIGRGKVPKRISYSSCKLHDFYNESYNVGSGSPPIGTICYQAVEVLE